MKTKIIILIMGFFLIINVGKSQTETAYNMYNLEPVMLNPAGAGLSANPTVFLDYNRQWAGFDGAPEMYSGSVHGLIFNNMGAGLNFAKYSSSIFNTVSASLNYAYQIKINEDQMFIPGVYVGAKQMSLNTAGLTGAELEDPAIYSNNFDKVIITSGLGLRYKYKNLTLDFAVPNLYSGDEKKIAQSILGFAAYDFYTKDDKWRIQPGVIYRYTAPQTNLVDVNFLLEYDKMLWTQVGYRTNKDVNMMLGVNFKGIGIAYNYTLTNSGMESYSNGSHEIALLYRIPFSFVKE